MRALRLTFEVLLFACVASPAIDAAVSAPIDCLVLDIDQIGHERLAQMTRVAGADVWLELDDELFACGAAAELAALEQLAPVKRSLGRLQRERLRLAYRLSRAELDERGLRILAAGGLFAVVESPGRDDAGAEGHGGLLPFRPRLVLARQLANQPSRARLAAGEGTVAGLVSAVDSDRWLADVISLAGFNRYSLGSEIEEARRWLVREFRRLPGLKVRSHYFDVRGARVANVVATLGGRSRPEDWFVVGGHYDSISESPLSAAPGAEDNASGCAGVLEMARIFVDNPPEATILFVCYAGEEQGLFGGTDHVTRLLSSGNADKVGAMLNLDMIGFSEDEDLDALLQSSVAWQFLIDALIDAAERHTELRLVTALLLGGSDHVPYAHSGIPAVLSIENDWSTYPHYHRTTDTPDKLTPEIAAEILRMNVGALARLTGNSDASGCLTLEGEPLVGVDVVSIQPGRPRQAARTDRQGCVAVDPLARGKSFRLKAKGPELSGQAPTVSGCARLLGEPLENRRAIFRQRGQTVQKTRSDEQGCFSFEAAPDERFTLILKGPKLPAA